MSKRSGIILVLYSSRGMAQLPLRVAVSDHLFCWGRYSKHDVIYRNVAFGFSWDEFRDLPIRAVVFHTILLATRWDIEVFWQLVTPLFALRDFSGPKIAIPQDEFIQSEALVTFFNRVRITHILTAATVGEARRIYDGLATEAELRTVLTGYLDEVTLRQIRRLRRSVPDRDIDIGYRAWNAEAWLGEHGRLKVLVAHRVAEAAERHPDLRTDVSVDETSTLLGADWLRFMLRCRTMLGVEGGASVLDRDGSIARRTRAFVAANPEASFEDIRKACFADEEGSLDLRAIGPRHLEACATETCQVLVEGDYQGILKPHEHYIPIRKDFSNLDEVLRQIADRDQTAAVAGRARRDVVESGRYTYRRFVREIEDEIIDLQGAPVPARASARASWLAVRFAQVRHSLSWVFAQFEAKHLLRNREYRYGTPEEIGWRWRAIRSLVRSFGMIIRIDTRI